MINRTFRLFVSSTFKDFIEERSILNNNIFNLVDNHCQEKGYNFQMIDLRWGINEEASLNQQTLDICLEEAKRCKTLSPKPNFLIMIGERYGWVPLPYTIEKKEYETLIEHCNENEKVVLERWYKCDFNSLKEEYYILPRTGIYTDDLIWEKEENYLKTILLKAIKNIDIDEIEIRKYTASATEHEILCGLLNNDETSDNVIALFRTGYPEKDDDISKIVDLKKQIKSRMCEDGVSNNIIELEYNEEYLADFEKNIFELLIRNIDEEIERLDREYEKKDVSLLKVRDSHEFFQGRDTELEFISNYTNSDSENLLFICGESGTGKTSLLREFLLNHTQGKECFFSFFGYGDKSYTLVSCIQEICNSIIENYKITKSVSVTINNIAETFSEVLQLVPENENCVIIIDGLDMFYDIEDIYENIFPNILPSGVKIIISAADKTIVKKFSSEKDEKLELNLFDYNDSHSILSKMIREKGRTICNEKQQKSIDDVIENGCSPLQLMLLANYCSKWHSSDTIEELPLSEHEIVVTYINRMFADYGHYKELVCYALAFISVAPFGITEEELQVLLFEIDEIRTRFDKDDRYGYVFNRLPFVMWSRLFYDLKDCLSLAVSKGRIVVKFIHNVFYRVFQTEYIEYCDKAKDILIKYYLELDNYLDATKKNPNYKKMHSILQLLLRAEKFDCLANLLDDEDFKDAMIKSGNLDDLMVAMLSTINVLKDKSVVKHLNENYQLLFNNSDELRCYKSNYYSCVKNQQAHFITKATVMNEQAIFFPFDDNAQVSWNENGNKYAVAIGPYVYVCDRNTQAIMTRVYIEQNKNVLKNTVKSVDWLDESKLLVVTSDTIANIYDVSDRIPNIIDRIELNCDNTSTLYSKKNGILVYVQEKSLIGYELQERKVLYKIRLNIINRASFSFDSSQKELIVVEGGIASDIYDLSTGVKKRSFKIPPCYEENISRSFGWLNRNVYKFGQGLWLIQGRWVENGLSIYNEQTKERIFIHPPMVENLRKYIIGTRCIMFLYDDVICLIDLTDFSLKFKKTPSVLSFGWVCKDESIYITTKNEMYIVKSKEFEAVEGFPKCFFADRNVFSISFKYSAKDLSANNRMFSKIFPFENYLYSYEYLIYNNKLEASVAEDYATFSDYDDIVKGASLIEFAENGAIAVGFEGKDEICVFDSTNKLLFSIRNLKLAIDNSIIKLKFSSDSRYLLVVKTQAVLLIDVNEQKITINIALPERAPMFVDFSYDNRKILLKFANEADYEIDLEKVDKKYIAKMHREVFEDIKAENFTLPFYINMYDIERDFDLINGDNFEYNPDPRFSARWFENNRIYKGESCYIVFKNGQFYFNGSERFENLYCDFQECVQKERQKNSFGLFSFLHEKNDISSRLIEYNAGKYILLISKLLNSVVLFDTVNLAIVEAKKIQGNIIGIKEVENQINLYIDQAPYIVELKVEIQNCLSKKD